MATICDWESIAPSLIAQTLFRLGCSRQFLAALTKFQLRGFLHPSLFCTTLIYLVSCLRCTFPLESQLDTQRPYTRSYPILSLIQYQSPLLLYIMDFIKNAMDGNNNQGGQNTESGGQNSGGGGFMGGITEKMNSAAGGGRDSEKNEDFLDKGSWTPPSTP